MVLHTCVVGLINANRRCLDDSASQRSTSIVYPVDIIKKPAAYCFPGCLYMRAVSHRTEGLKDGISPDGRMRRSDGEVKHLTVMGPSDDDRTFLRDGTFPRRPQISRYLCLQTPIDPDK